MSYNQLIISEGIQGQMEPTGSTGPAGSSFIGSTGPQGPTGAAGITFPYSVLSGDATFTNIGSSNGEFVLNTTGYEITGIQGITFSAMLHSYITSSASYAIDYNNITGASAGVHFDSTVNGIVIDCPITFNGSIHGFTASILSGATGPQGPTGAQGNPGTVGPTGSSTGFPYDVSVSGNADFINVGDGSGSLNITNNGITINAVTSSLSSSLLLSYNGGTSYSLWIDNTNQPIQIDVPITFTNQVISTFYNKNSLIFENISGGPTQAILYNTLTSSSTASIQYSNIIGASYGVWYDNSVQNIQIDCPVTFTGTVSGIGAVGPTGPIGPTGPAGGSGSTAYYGLFTSGLGLTSGYGYQMCVGVTSSIYGTFGGGSASGYFTGSLTSSQFVQSITQSGFSLGATPSNLITILNSGTYYLESSLNFTWNYYPGFPTYFSKKTIALFVNGVNVNQMDFLDQYYNVTFGSLNVNFNTSMGNELLISYVGNFNAGDTVNCQSAVTVFNSDNGGTSYCAPPGNGLGLTSFFGGTYSLPHTTNHRLLIHSI